MKKLVIFDLDFTLWDACGTWCDHTNPPYRKVDDYVKDSTGGNIVLYPDVYEILEYIHSQHIQMGLASRTGEPTWAEELLRLFEIEKYFIYKEIYPANKTRHFSSIQKQSNIEYSDMVFFDDEMRNIHDVSALGVEAVYVSDGIHLDLVKQYIT